METPGIQCNKNVHMRWWPQGTELPWRNPSVFITKCVTYLVTEFVFFELSAPGHTLYLSVFRKYIKHVW